MTILSSTTIFGFGCKGSFGGSGGTGPYTYSVESGGVGGTITSSGLYTSPNKIGRDTIVVIDSLGERETLEVSVLSPLELVCDIIQKEMNLGSGRVWIWNQKIDRPIDDKICVAISVMGLKTIGNVNKSVSTVGGLVSQQSVTMRASVSVDIISKSLDAYERKEEVLMALNSVYSQNQQLTNFFKISSVTSEISSVSSEDGAAIPYRFNFTVQIFYSIGKNKSIDYFDKLPEINILTNN